MVSVAATLAAAIAAAALAAPAAPSDAPMPLSGRVIAAGEFPPFMAGSLYQTRYASAKAWIDVDTTLTPIQADARAARLRREGYVAAIAEQLSSAQANRAGLSFVIQLGSAAAAKAELAAEIGDQRADNRPPAGAYAPFAVPGIPGAQGSHLERPPTNAGDNVVFADGPFLYLVGDGWSPASAKGLPRAQLIAATKRLYTRVHGRPAR